MKKSQLKRIIKEEIKSVIKEDYEDWKEGKPSAPDERNPSNEMIYNLLKEVKALVIKNKPHGKIDI